MRRTFNPGVVGSTPTRPTPNSLVLTAKLTATRSAFDAEDSPPFEVIAQLIICEIEADETKEAAQLLGQLDQRFSNRRRDIRVGLRCRLELRQGHYGDALTQGLRMENKNTPFYRHIRREGLKGELEYTALTDERRIEYQLEVEKLEQELFGVSEDRLAPDELDIVPGTILS